MSDQSPCMRVMAAMVALAKAQDDEALEVLADDAERLVLGNSLYGPLADNHKDWLSEADDEWADSVVYMLIYIRRRARAKRLREERRDSFPEEDRL